MVLCGILDKRGHIRQANVLDNLHPASRCNVMGDVYTLPLAVLYAAVFTPCFRSIKTNHRTINSWDFKIAEIITYVAFELNEGILYNLYLTLLLIKQVFFLVKNFQFHGTCKKSKQMVIDLNRQAPIIRSWNFKITQHIMQCRYELQVLP